jgi:hypothetical protein
VMESRTVVAWIGEGDLAKGLKAVQERFPDVVMGSYPFVDGVRFGSNLVLRGRDVGRLEAAVKEVEAMVAGVKASGVVRVWD